MMNDITLRIIEALVLYDIFKLFINLTLRVFLGVLQGDNNE